MKICVTGGAGFIGSNIAKELVKQGHEIVVVDNLVNGKLENLDPYRDKIEFIKGDIRDIELLKKVFKGVEAISHQAALISVVDSIKQPELYEDVNVNGTKNVLEAAKECNVKKVVFASSCALYGNNKNLPIKETEEPMPTSPYADTKVKGENLLKEYHEKYGLKTICLRYFNILGPGQDPNSPYAAVIPIFISKLLKDEPPFVYGNGEQTRDFIYIKDVVNANIKALLENNIEHEIINVATGKETSVNQLLEKLNSILGKDIKPIYKDAREGDIKKSYADISKFKTLLNIDLTDLETALKETIKCFQ